MASGAFTLKLLCGWCGPSSLRDSLFEGLKPQEVWQLFTRYSNISSADYHAIRLQMLDVMNISPSASLTESQMKLLSELEHIRWTRYHWLNNWQFGIPDSGKSKDASLRIHIDLIPYRDLPDYEKQKDRNTITLMLGL